MAFVPKHLTPEQIDTIYTDELRQLEAMHLRSLVTARREAAFGANRWNTDAGEDLIAAVRQEWHEARHGPVEAAPPVTE